MLKRLYNLKEFILLFLTFLAFAFLISSQILYTYDQLKASNAEYAETTVELLADTVDLWFEQNIKTLETIAIDVEKIQDTSTLQAIIDEQHAVSNSAVMYVGLEDDTFISSNVDYEHDKAASYKPTERPWYQEAMASPNQEVVISSPYVDYFTGELSITFSKYVGEIDGKDAVIAFDVLLDDLIDTLEQHSSGPFEYFFIIDNEGNIVYHPNTEFQYNENGLVQVQSIPEYEYLLDTSNEGEINKITDYDGEEKHLISQVIDSTGWQIVGVVNEDVIAGQMMGYLKNGFIVFVLLSGLLTSIAWILIKNKKEKELVLKNNMFNSAISSADTFVLEYDAVKNSAIASTSLCELFGLPENLSGLPESLFDYDIIAEEDIEFFIASLKKAVKNNKKNSFQVRLKDKGNKELWYLITLNNFFDEKGTVVKSICVVKCIDKEVRFKNLSVLDQSTGFYNKENGVRIAKETIYSISEDTDYSILVLDIDDFKNVNDTFGHVTGDEVIIEVTKSIKDHFRAEDILLRAGGDEFVMLAVDLNEEAATAKATNILNSVMDNPKLTKYSVTVSIGIASSKNKNESYEELFARADRALYKAKGSGKNSFNIQ